MNKITIRDIARLSNCSITTVSKILNSKDQDISEETKKRVLTVIKENHYIPNQVASSLVTGRSQYIGLIIPDIANPFFPEVARGAEDKAFKNGACLVLCNSENSVEKEKAYVKFLVSKMVDGIILAGCGSNYRQYKELVPERTALVLVDRMVNVGIECPAVLSDNQLGMSLAIEHLIGLGHRKIAFIGGVKNTWISKSRLKGYLSVLKKYGLPYRDELVLHGNYSYEWGTEAIDRLLEGNADFTAVACGNDLIALGVQRILLQRGYKIPQQYSITGYDNIFLADYPRIQLTTIDQPKYKMGSLAAETLMDLINGKTIEKICPLTPELVIRSTTGVVTS